VSFVPSLFGVVLLLAGMSSSATVNARAKPMNACHLLTSAQASSLLGGTVTATNATSTTVPQCRYWLSSSGPRRFPGLWLALRPGTKPRATYDKLLHHKSLRYIAHHLSIQPDVSAHRIKIDGTESFFVVENMPIGTLRAFTSAFVSYRGRYEVVIGAQTTRRNVAVGLGAMRDVLARLR
jgi:hypothetical protein